MDTPSVGSLTRQIPGPTPHDPPTTVPADTPLGPHTGPRFAAAPARSPADVPRCAAPAGPADAPRVTSTTHAPRYRTAPRHHGRSPIRATRPAPSGSPT